MYACLQRIDLSPRHVVLRDTLLPAAIGTGLMAVAAIVALQASQEDRVCVLS